MKSHLIWFDDAVRHRYRRRPTRDRKSETTSRENAELAARPPDRFGNGRPLGNQWPYGWWRH